jgi:hypothetical protein
MGYSGTWGILIRGKNLKSKISWHCPFYSVYPVRIHKYQKIGLKSMETAVLCPSTYY